MTSRRGSRSPRISLPAESPGQTRITDSVRDLKHVLSTVALLRTPAPTAEVTRFRHWYLEQIHAQLGEAAPPRQFPG